VKEQRQSERPTKPLKIWLGDILNLKQRLQHRVKLFGRLVPVYLLLFIMVFGAVGAIVIVLQQVTQEEISVESVGLVYLSGDVTISGSSVIISYSTYESAVFDSDNAYTIGNQNLAGKHIKLVPQTPTGDMSQVLAYSCSIDGISMLDHDGVSWTTSTFGIVNGQTGTVSIHLETGSGISPISINTVFDLELLDTEPWLASYSWIFVNNPQAYQAHFTGSSLPGETFWVGSGAGGSQETIDHVICTVAGTNYTNTVLHDDYVLEAGGSADFIAEWITSVEANLATDFYLYITENAEYTHVLP